MDVDIVCVGFGPATAGFLHTMSGGVFGPDGSVALESRVTPGMPPQILCYERSDDLGFGVSGVVTRARALKESLPDLEQAGIPMAAPVIAERMVYLLDPIGASRRPKTLRVAEAAVRAAAGVLGLRDHAVELPWVPEFLHKTGGMILSLGQFLSWMGAKIQATGAVQIWPGSPVACALKEQGRVVGVRLVDQGVDAQGQPTDGFLPGMDIRAALTVVGDGPVGTVGQQLDAEMGLPPGHQSSDWAIGMKFVVDLPETCGWAPGTVLHTLGYPEPEIFGFLYVHPDRVASLGIFVPSWFDSPVRTAYRYLQHWMLHPYLWRRLEGGRLRSWGAKTLGESGRRGEPHLVGDGYARIGEGSGTTNVLTGSGVDEAWASGVQLGEAVLELLRAGQPFTREHLEQTYVRRRRASWVETEGAIAETSRDGFHHGFVRGLAGMAITGLTRGRFSLPGAPLPPWKRLPTLERYYRGRLGRDEIDRLRSESEARGVSLHGMLMDRVGWPSIPFDGQLLMSHQDALLLGGKVQAPPGYADHVVFLYPELCLRCGTRICIEACSGQAIGPGPGGAPVFDRDKCIHCGACRWNCSQPLPEDSERTNIAFRAGPGGLHSAEN